MWPCWGAVGCCAGSFWVGALDLVGGRGVSVSWVLNLGLGRSVVGGADLCSSAVLRPISAQNANKVVICWI